MGVLGGEMVWGGQGVGGTLCRFVPWARDGDCWTCHRIFQPNCANFNHGRLLCSGVFNTSTLALRCRQGASTPSLVGTNPTRNSTLSGHRIAALFRTLYLHVRVGGVAFEEVRRLPSKVDLWDPCPQRQRHTLDHFEPPPKHALLPDLSAEPRRRNSSIDALQRERTRQMFTEQRERAPVGPLAKAKIAVLSAALGACLATPAQSREPNSAVLRDICSEIADKTMASGTPYMFNHARLILTAAGLSGEIEQKFKSLNSNEQQGYVAESDLTEDQLTYLRKWWRRAIVTEENLTCTSFGLGKGSIIKYAFKMETYDLIRDVIKWGLFLNAIDYRSNETVLDWIEHQQLLTNPGSSLWKDQDRYIRLLRKAGAKRRSELSEAELVVACAPEVCR